jgi:hypothetical protein
VKIAWRILAVVVSLGTYPPAAAQWRADILAAPGRVSAIETAGADVRVQVEGKWYRLTADGRRLEAASGPSFPPLPAGALPDARVATGAGGIVRAWLAEPTTRYAHGILGDAIEAGSLVIERRHGGRVTLRLDPDAVFEDIAPRMAMLGGVERIIVVKSYLDRGSALAVVDAERGVIVAETPAIGRPNAWLNPAGVADYDGDGSSDIALVRQPHVVGRLELWSWRDGRLERTAEIADVSNHAIGSRALAMSATADFDGDGRPDLAIPSLDRRSLRLIGFVPYPRDIARLMLPARIVTNLGLVTVGSRAALIAGLENGELVVVHDSQPF